MTFGSRLLASAALLSLVSLVSNQAHAVCWAPGGQCRRSTILSSRENPKICGIDDAEVVGDLVAVDRPVPRHLLAQKSQYRTSEILNSA